MEYKEIQNLIKLIDSTDLTEFKMKEGDFELMIRTKDYYKLSKEFSKHVVAPAPVIQATSAPASFVTPVAETEQVSSGEQVSSPTTEEKSEVKLLEIRSPIVGTFYRAPSPDKEPYLKIGDKVEVGSVVCIVEAMKLFNEIESEVGGKIVEIVVDDSTPVEYDQVLFRVDPS